MVFFLLIILFFMVSLMCYKNYKHTKPGVRNILNDKENPSIETANVDEGIQSNFKLTVWENI